MVRFLVNINNKPKINDRVDPHFSCASPLDGETRFLLLLENHLKKNGLESHLFLFLF